MFKRFILLGCPMLSLNLNALPYEIPQYNDLAKARLSSVECLAVNAYHEARSESDLANVAIFSVVMNRVNDDRYPNDVCKVVFKKHAFSWTGNGLSDKIHNTKQYKRLYKLAEKFILNRNTMMSLSQGVDHYHTVNSKPYWSESDKLKYIMTVDNHKFYKWIK